MTSRNTVTILNVVNHHNGVNRVGIAERKEREKEDVRKKILDAAHDLFEAQGYENVTMRAVADAIEYSPTTIYLHFANKDALVEALCFDESVLVREVKVDRGGRVLDRVSDRAHGHVLVALRFEEIVGGVEDLLPDVFLLSFFAFRDSHFD